MKESRHTIQNTIIYEKVQAMHNHPTADDIYQEIKKDYPHISKGTVYRNLNRLAAEGEITRIKVPNDADRYDYQIHFHHHLKCNVCGRIIDVEIKNKENVLNTVVNNDEFLIESYQILFSGKCNNCLNTRKTNYLKSIYKMN